MAGYKPSWFYASALLGNAASLYIVPPKTVPEHETLKVRSRSGQGGYVCYDVLRAEKSPEANESTICESKNKVVFIVPGVNSSIQDHHICATASQAVKQGYHCVVVNPVRPDFNSGITDLELIDYSKVEPISESIQTIKELFGADCEIYAIGFSLGSNHLLRHLGAHKNCKHECGIKAAVSITGAYDVRSNALVLRNRLGGVYDKVMRQELQNSLNNSHYKVFNNDKTLKERVNSARCLTELDSLTRAPVFGYRGASRLFRNVSCDAYVSQIETPLLALSTKDDSITDFKFVPVEDLSRNPNVMFATLERGGHCDLFFQQEDAEGRPGDHKELAPLLALEYFDKAHEYYSALKQLK